MATFRKRYDKWQARVQRSDGPHLTKTFTNLIDAQKWARKIEREFDQGYYETVKPYLPLKEALKRYQKEISIHKKRHQIEGYRIDAWISNDLSKLSIHQIRTQHLAVWRNNMVNKGFQPNTIRLHLAVLSHLFTIAQTEWGFEELKNPVTNLTKPRCAATKNNRISDNEITLLIKNTGSLMLPNIIKFALYTAMRRSEIVKLKWNDIDWNKNTILVSDTKNGENRTIPLFNSIQELLQQIPKVDPRVFPITEHAVTIAFRRSVIRSNLTNMSFHTLRHEAISRFFEQGLSIPEVAMISGHKSWSMLRRYTHLQTIINLNKLTNL